MSGEGEISDSYEMESISQYEESIDSVHNQSENKEEMIQISSNKNQMFFRDEQNLQPEKNKACCEKNVDNLTLTEERNASEQTDKDDRDVGKCEGNNGKQKDSCLLENKSENSNDLLLDKTIEYSSVSNGSEPKGIMENKSKNDKETHKKHDFTNLEQEITFSQPYKTKIQESPDPDFTKYVNDMNKEEEIEEGEGEEEEEEVTIGLSVMEELKIQEIINRAERVYYGNSLESSSSTININNADINLNTLSTNKDPKGTVKNKSKNDKETHLKHDFTNLEQEINRTQPYKSKLQEIYDPDFTNHANDTNKREELEEGEVEEEKEEVTIGLSVMEELEIQEIIERAERVYYGNSIESSLSSMNISDADINLNTPSTNKESNMNKSDYFAEEECESSEDENSSMGDINIYKPGLSSKLLVNTEESENSKAPEDQHHHGSESNKHIIMTDDKSKIMRLASIALGETEVPSNNKAGESKSQKLKRQKIEAFIKGNFDQFMPKQIKSNNLSVKIDKTNVKLFNKNKIVNLKLIENEDGNHTPSLTHGKKNTAKVNMKNGSYSNDNGPMEDGSQFLGFKFEVDRDDDLVCETSWSRTNQNQQEKCKESNTLNKYRTGRKRTCTRKELPMNDPKGDFFLDRDLVPVDIYQEGLLLSRWNPTSVLNEICGKCGWPLPTFTDVDYNADGFLVCVNVKNREFYSKRRARIKKEAKHLASTHALEYMGFRFEYRPSQTSAELKDLIQWDKFNDFRRPKTPEELKGYSDEWYSSPPKFRKHERSVRRDSPDGNDHWRSSSVGRTPRPSKRDYSHTRSSRESRHSPGKHRSSRSESGRCYSPRPTSTSSPNRHSKHGDCEEEYVRSRKEDNHKKREKSPAYKPRMPPKWDTPDEILPFVPRHSQNYSSGRHSPVKLARSPLLPTPSYSSFYSSRVPASVVVPHKCQCKLSFPHPSIHPWRHEMEAVKRVTTGSRRNK